MLVRVISGADSIFEFKLLIPLSHDATSAAVNEAAPITHKSLGLDKFQFQKWTWHAKIPLETKFKVSMTSIMLIMVVCPFYILRNGDEQTDRALVSWNFQHSPPFETC